jgi:hypothetical protein
MRNKQRGHKSALAYRTQPKRGILKQNAHLFVEPQESFANPTISSAIKADYTLPEVKFKLDELNASVKKTRIIKNSPPISKVIKARVNHYPSKPFVVRRVS